MVKVLLIIFAFQISYYQVTGQTEIKKVRLDPKNAYGGTVSEYFDGIEYIPLETNNESLFGDVYNLLATDSSYVITDGDTRATLFFNLKGRFIKKIAWPRTVSYVKTKYSDFSKTISLFYMDPMQETKVKMIEIVSLHGNKLDTQKANSDSRENNTFPIDSNYVIKFSSCSFSDPSNIKDSLYYLIEVFKGNLLYKQLLPYNQKEKMAFCYIVGRILENNLVISPDGGLYLSTPIENTVYRVTKNEATPILTISFPINLAYETSILGNHNFKEIDSVKKIARRVGTIYNFSSLILYGKKLFFKGDAGLYFSNVSNEPNRLYNFIYDTAANKFTAIERIRSDSSNSYLPIYNVLNDGLMINGLKYKDGYFYSHVSSLEMFAAHEKNKDRNPQYPPVLQQYFKAQTRKSNPVIVKMKLKE